MAYENSAEVNVNVQPHDSPHVLAFTNVRRGMTPATWDATGEPDDIAGVWMASSVQSGPADRDGNVTGEFPDGSDQWQQT